MTVNIAKKRGWVFYDAECRFCNTGRNRWGPLFERRGFEWLPLQTPGAAERLGITDTQLLEAMWLQPADGRAVGGVNAWSVLMRSVWWLWPLGALIPLPGLNALASAVYRWVARNRYCIAGRCRIHPRGEAGTEFIAPLSFVVVLGLVVAWGRERPAWVFMWALAISLGQFAKWLAWKDARNSGMQTPAGRTIGWFLLWPGMDARAFFNRTLLPTGAVREWFTAIFKLALGISIIWCVAPRWLADKPLALGWVEMIGIILCLHFGLFHLMSLAWRACGVNALPIMYRPLAARSLAEFWGERWNTGFSIPARRFLFTPLVRRVGAGAAFAFVFLLSGLLHELVISVPARGGYGLPTAYFMLQGTGVLLERSRLGKALGLGKGVRGRLFMFTFTAGPVFWLFHPPFVYNVILPMLHALGAA